MKEQENFGHPLRIADLIAGFIQGTLSVSDTEELDAWLEADPDNKALFQSMTDPALLQKGYEAIQGIDTDRGWTRVRDIVAREARQRAARHRRYRWLAAAALAGLLIGGGTWWLLHSRQAAIPQGTLAGRSAYGQEIQPGRSMAALLTGDGQHIQLDGSPVALPSYAHLTPDSGLTYAGGTADEMQTLAVPVGGTYRMVLPDGTRVWLNAASTLRFPSRFEGSERRVTLTGEAYFEVASNKSMPFRVYCRGIMTEAVGTAFNVNGYAHRVTTTLIHGVVRVRAGRQAVLLHPGDAVGSIDSGRLAAVAKGDTAEAAGWQHGYFTFDDTPVREVMAELGRWYGTSVVYDRDFDRGKSFTGEISRQVPLSKLLDMMAMTGIAGFKVDKNTVYVLPYTPATGDARQDGR